MGHSRAEIHNEIALTRKRMAETLGELESRIGSRVDAVKDRLDVAALVRDYPWMSLGAALAAGYAVAASGADGKAADAVAVAAKEGAEATKDAAVGAVAAVKERFSSSGDEQSTGDGHSAEPKPSLLERLAARAGDWLAEALEPHVEKLGGEMRIAAGDLTRRLAGTGTGTPEFAPPRSADPLVGGRGGGEIAALDRASSDGAEA